MSSKLVVPADIFNLFETEKFSKLQSKRRDSSSSENSTKSDETKIKEAPILTKNKNHVSPHLKLEKSDILDKIESGDEANMSCSNTDNLENNNVVESQMNGEPPTTTNIPTVPSVMEHVENSLLQTVGQEGTTQLQTKNNKSNVPVFLIKNSSGKSVPLVLKKSVLIKNSEINNRTFIQVPSYLTKTPILLFTPPCTSSEVVLTKPETSENLTEISTPQITPKLVIDRKLVEYQQNSSTASTSVNSASTIQEFVIKTPSGKQVIIPNKLKPLKQVPSVETPEEAPQTAPKNVTFQEKNTQHSVINHKSTNTKNILINNQLVPVDLNTKFTVETGSNTQSNISGNNDSILNIITKKSVDKTLAKPENIKKETNSKDVERKKSKRKLKQPKINVLEEKLYQIQVRPNLVKPKEEIKNLVEQKNEVDLLKGCVQMPMYVENWTQTDVKQQDTACQTDVYVAPPPVYEPIGEESLNIPELIDYLLDIPKYSTGLDEVTKTDIINNSLKFKQPEPAPMASVNKPAPTLKEQLFFDLRDCIGFDFLGNMPIHNAVHDNSLKDLKRQIFALRLRRFNVDVLNNFDQTALQLAIINNQNQDIITALLANGANVFVKDNLGNTLLHLAVLNTNATILDLISSYLNKEVKFLNTKNDEGLTPLMVAAVEAKPDLVAVLLKHGADPDVRDEKSGRTALFHAVELNNVSVITMLLRNRADPKIRNYFGLTALDAVKDLNAPVASMIERQATRSEQVVSPKKRVNKRRTANNKIAVVSKKLKVDLGSLDKQNNCASGSDVHLKQVSPMRKRT